MKKTRGNFKKKSWGGTVLKPDSTKVVYFNMILGQSEHRTESLNSPEYDRRNQMCIFRVKLDTKQDLKFTHPDQNGEKDHVIFFLIY